MALLLVGLASAVSAETGVRGPQVRIVWADVPPAIDGVLDDSAWNGPAQIQGLQGVEPVAGGEPTQRTLVWLLTTTTHLYVGIRCHDSNPEGIVAQRMLRDDSLVPDDRVGITLGPYGDRRNGFFFQVNPNGVRRDILIEGQSFETNWDGFWKAKTSIDEGGWSAEIAIPYQTLSFDSGEPVWDLNVHRVVRRVGERTRWSNTEPSRSVLDVGIAGRLEGMTGLQQGLGLEVVPSLTARYIAEDSDGEDDYEVDPSGDVFYHITPALTAAATANTDFGETEADLRQLNLTRFDPFFPERRDFFLEDGLIFDFANIEQNGRPFFSRRIGLDEDGERVDILGAGKLTGRIGPVKIGALHAHTDGYEDTTDQAMTVVRPAVNVFGESTLGAIYTRGNPAGGFDNQVVGTDFLFRNSELAPGRALEGAVWAQRSFSGIGAPPEVAGDDEWAYGASLSYPNDVWNWRVGFQELQENFFPALGFVNRVGIRAYDASLRHRMRWSGWLRTFDQQVLGQLVTERGATVETGRLEVRPLVLESEVGDSLRLAYVHRFERPLEDFDIAGVDIAADRYHFDEAEIRLTAAQNRPLSGVLLVSYGTFFDGRRLLVNGRLSWRPSRHWLIEPEYRFRELDLPGGHKELHLARLRVNLQFTPEISWITLAQWDDVSDSIGINTRLRWILEDGREVFLVVNQDLDSRNRIRQKRTETILKLEWALRF